MTETRQENVSFEPVQWVLPQGDTREELIVWHKEHQRSMKAKGFDVPYGGPAEEATQNKTTRDKE